MGSAVEPQWPKVLYPPGVRAAAGAGDGLRRWLMPVLVPASWLYQGVSSAVRSSRAADPRPGPAGVRVVSVGNLEVGGGGKTPLAMKLAEELVAVGARPVYVSRGFGGEAGRLGVVTVVPAASGDDSGALPPGVRYLRRGGARLAALAGDEGAMVAHRLPDIPLLFCPDKSRALEAAASMFTPTHAVMDDAFQSWGVPRDVDVVVVDGLRPFADGWCLPAGRLREPPEALARADYVGFGGVEDEEQLSRALEKVQWAAGVTRPSFGIRRRIEVVPAGEGRPRVDADETAALSAIARPEAFERQLTASGLCVAAAIRYPDHHAYTARDLEWIVGVADRLRIESVVTTEKDWAKLRGLDPPAGRFRIALLSLELFGDDPLADIKKAAE
jgi:tetraacyldisaccharide 4'-kinase